mgnify:CR=1 FL=1
MREGPEDEFINAIILLGHDKYLNILDIGIDTNYLKDSLNSDIEDKVILLWKKEFNDNPYHYIYKDDEEPIYFKPLIE